MNEETENYLVRHIEDLENQLYTEKSKSDQRNAIDKALSEALHLKNQECDTQYDLISQIGDIIRKACFSYGNVPTVTILPDEAKKLCTLLGIDMQKEAEKNDKNGEAV